MSPRRYIVRRGALVIACDLTQTEARALARKRDAMRPRGADLCHVEVQP